MAGKIFCFGSIGLRNESTRMLTVKNGARYSG